MKEKYIQYCCDFYNEHSPKDREWFGRMYEQCQEDYEQQNMCMYHWQFPLMVLKAEQAQIDELNIKNQRYLGKMQEQQDQIAELKKELKEWKSKSLAAMLHGTCNCGEPWQSIVSDKEGFNRLHCFKCNHDKYENKGFYGDHEPKE